MHLGEFIRASRRVHPCISANISAVQVLDHPWAFFASATLGVAASFMTFLVIKVTNAVTLKVHHHSHHHQCCSGRSFSTSKSYPARMLIHHLSSSSQVLNTARNAAFVLFTVTFVGEEASWLQLCGYVTRSFGLHPRSYLDPTYSYLRTPQHVGT